jgi:DNA-binding NtrC family response regulator
MGFKPQLIILEEDAELRWQIIEIATDLGFTALSVVTMREFVLQYQQMLPDAIVMELVSHDIDGFELLNYLSEQNSAAHLVLRSAEASYLQIAKRLCEVQGLQVAECYVTPLRLDMLRLTLEQLAFTIRDQRQRAIG